MLCITSSQVDVEINGLFMRLPNLLDSRVPDGDGEEENEVVAEWGQEYVKTGEVNSRGLVGLRSYCGEAPASSATSRQC